MTRIETRAEGGSGIVGGEVLDLGAERGAVMKAEGWEKGAESSHKKGCEPLATAVAKAGDSSGSSGVWAASPRMSESGLNASNRSSMTRVEELSQIHKMKTGALVAAALDLGAMTAQADPEQRKRLREYGHCIGLAFQITDDLLDVTGDSTRLGKTPGRDADLGKLTYPGLLGIENSYEKAEQLVQEACAAVAVFGDRGKWLKELAQFILERDH